jgi:hypothetical protein
LSINVLCIAELWTVNALVPDTGDPDPLPPRVHLGVQPLLYNKRLKRIVYFSRRSVSKATADGDALSTPGPLSLLVMRPLRTTDGGGGETVDGAESSLPARRC